MEPWYRVVTPREEVRKGRSFHPDEFAIALEQVVARTAPEDYWKPEKFFARNYFTRALQEHTGMVLRRLAGRTENTAPVLTLVTQFGGGKTHTLTTLFHLANSGSAASEYAGVPDLLRREGLSEAPGARVAVFVGNAWDPQEGRETPWIDIARQLAGDAGVDALGAAARSTAPGTEALGRVFSAAGAPVLVLCDEVLNFCNRHRGMVDQFYAFIQNLTVAITGTTHGAAVISLPRSQVEMTEWDLQWQEKITKVVRRVAQDLIANDEAEISEVVRRRLFEALGSERLQRNVARAYADWCFERRAQLPPEWTAVDTATTEATAREFLRKRFESCYPFHPATLSVFQRKWQPLAQYQQTRGTLAMFAQWISWIYREGYQSARREPLITLGTAPLHVPEFRAVVLGQLGEQRLAAAIETDIAGEQSHARALDVDTRGALKDIHRRAGTAILFESSGGQVDRVAHLPELRFALGEPELDTTSIDNAALALEAKGFFISRVGSDGLKIYHKATIRKAVSDRRASLDEVAEVRPALRELVKREFERGASLPLALFPDDGAAIEDSPRLKLVLMDPSVEWSETGSVREQISEWTQRRGKSARLYPGALVWCLKTPGRELREKVALWLAWKRVEQEVASGTLGTDYDRADRQEIESKLREAEGEAKDEVWAGYRFVVLFDSREPDGLKVIDLGAGHASSAATLCGRVIAALKSQALLNETVGAGYIERNWPPALKESGAWPLASLRQCFLNGALTRLLDPDTALRTRIQEFVCGGDFGLASGARSDGTYERVWYKQPIASEEITFESGVFLLTKAKAEALTAPPVAPPAPESFPVSPQPPTIIRDPGLTPGVTAAGESQAPTELIPPPEPQVKTLRLTGTVPPESWNRFGTRILPKLRAANGELKVEISLSVSLDGQLVLSLESDLRQLLADLDLAEQVRVESR